MVKLALISLLGIGGAILAREAELGGSSDESQ